MLGTRKHNTLQWHTLIINTTRGLVFTMEEFTFHIINTFYAWWRSNSTWTGYSFVPVTPWQSRQGWLQTRRHTSLFLSAMSLIFYRNTPKSHSHFSHLISTFIFTAYLPLPVGVEGIVLSSCVCLLTPNLRLRLFFSKSKQAASLRLVICIS